VVEAAQVPAAAVEQVAEEQGLEAAGAWELGASGPALELAERAREAVAEQGVAGEQEVRDLEAAVASEQAAGVPEPELAVEVQEQVVGEAVVGRAEDPAEELAELAKGPHLEDGRLRRRCCAGPWLAEQGAWQEFLAHQEKAAAVVSRWQKRMCDR
jgi:hypothetical protein